MRVEGTNVDQLRALWTKLEFAETLPPLNSHLCVPYKGDYLLLIGGEGKSGEILETDNPHAGTEEDGVINTVYRLNLKTRRISVLRQENSEFRPRMAHTGVHFRDNIFVFGGLEKGKVFNSQFLRMTVKKISSDKLNESKSTKPEPKPITSCKFCPGRASLKHSQLSNSIFSRKEWPDYSALEAKLKRRLT